MCFFRTRSFDSLVRLVASFLGSDTGMVGASTNKPTNPDVPTDIPTYLLEKTSKKEPPVVAKKKGNTRGTTTRVTKLSGRSGRSGGHPPSESHVSTTGMRNNLRSRGRTARNASNSIQDLPKRATRTRKRRSTGKGGSLGNKIKNWREDRFGKETAYRWNSVAWVPSERAVNSAANRVERLPG